MSKFLLLSFISIFLTGLFSSCFKDDDRIEPHKPGDFLTDTARLSDSYKYQIFYNLNSNQPVMSQLKTLWDLGFDNSADGWKIILNTSCFMKTAIVPEQVFGSQVDTIGLKWIFNPSDGSADSLTIGNWYTLRKNDTIGINRLILIDRGMNEMGVSRGFNQLIIDSLRNGIYYFKIADLNGNNIKSYSVTKEGTANYKLFSISNPNQNITEPDQNNWDLLFSQYTTLLFTNSGEPYPYLVTGVMLNQNGVEVSIDSLHPFNDITFQMAQEMSYSKQRDKIGYLWKVYDFDAGTYTVKSNINYIIKGVNGYYFKMRFVGFTNKQLEKGYISFEYQKL